MGVSMKAGSAKGTVDDVAVDPQRSSVGFGALTGMPAGANASTTRPVTTDLYVRAADETERTATVVTSLGAGRGDTMSFTPAGDGLALQHTGPAARYSLALSWAGPPELRRRSSHRRWRLRREKGIVRDGNRSKLGAVP